MVPNRREMAFLASAGLPILTRKTGEVGTNRRPQTVKSGNTHLLELCQLGRKIRIRSDHLTG